MLKETNIELVGGSGHEPAHAGYVGSGMLDAAVSGAIFASPNTSQIETGLRLVQSSCGTLIIVKNYTGDKLNFTLAAERFRIQSGTKVRLVVVADDVSIGRSKTARVGRRGLAGTILVHKIAGGASRAGESLEEIGSLAEFVIRHMGTIGVSLDGCNLPGKNAALRLAADEIELGIGIHNEPGSRKISPKPSPPELVKTMLANILDIHDEERNYLASPPTSRGHEVVLLVNNLGGLSTLELAAFVDEVCSQLGGTYDIKPARVYAGTYLTALNGPGFSITVLSLPREHTLTPKILEYLDSPTDALGWVSSIPTELWACRGQVAVTTNLTEATHTEADLAIPRVSCMFPPLLGLYGYGLTEVTGDSVLFKAIIKSIHDSLVNAEPEITRLDTMMGDGDCGTTLLAGIRSLVDATDNHSVDTSSLTHGVMSIAEALSESMGGTSGALYAVFFTALASSLCTSEETNEASFNSLKKSTSAALRSLEGVTAARVGDRTMMDALIPFVHSLEVDRDEDYSVALSRALEAAKLGCEGTSNIKSQFGRSTYISTEDVEDTTKGLADPGACGVVAIVEGILHALQHSNRS